MDLFLTVCELTLPVIVLIGLGVVCRARGIFDARAIDGLKRLISRYLMPFTLFNSLATIELSGTVAVLGVTCFCMCCLSLLLGHATRGICREFSYHPYLCSAYEIGMLGIALFPLLFGDTGLGYLASMDIGACFFFFCIYIPMLNSGKGDGPKQTLKNIFSSPALLACSAGIFCNLTGISRLVFGSAIGPVLDSIISMLTKSITPLILIVVGYGFQLSRRLLPSVLKTCAMRFAISIPVCLLALLALELFHIRDEVVRFAVIFVAALPAPFSTSVYAKDDLQQAYMNTQMSLYVIITILVFAVLCALA